MTFSLTMRLKPGGTFTGALFSIADKLAELCPEFLEDSCPLWLSVRLVGIAGDFTLEPQGPCDAKACDPQEAQASVRNTRRKLLWIAGGIGITPFLAMLYGIPSSCSTEYEITLLLSTREPDVMLSLLSNAIKVALHEIKLIVHIFSRTETFESSLPASVLLHHHSGRITSSIHSDLKVESQDSV